MEYPSKLIEKAVIEVSKLPGIGEKTALRLILHLLKRKKENTFSLTDSLNHLRDNILFCSLCHSISDTEECSICTSHRRNKSMVCVVEEARDVWAIENTSQYDGLYHVLGGVISPMNGVGPSDLKIDTLVQRVADPNSQIREFILALSPTMEGDTTTFYISKKLKEFSVKISSIARGIPVGGNLEFTDEITLGRSILGRIELT